MAPKFIDKKNSEKNGIKVDLKSSLKAAVQSLPDFTENGQIFKKIGAQKTVFWPFQTPCKNYFPLTLDAPNTPPPHPLTGFAFLTQPTINAAH